MDVWPRLVGKMHFGVRLITVFCLLCGLGGINLYQCISLPFFLVFGWRMLPLNRWVATTWWRLCLFCLEHLGLWSIVYSGHPLSRKETRGNVLLISNHQSMVDILVSMHFARKWGRMLWMNWFAKKSLSLIPGFGWGLISLGAIFLSRDWSKDRSSIQKTFARFQKYKHPLWLNLYPEGTRKTPEKLARTQRFMKKQGMVPFEKVLFPKTRGFSATLEGLEGFLDGIIDLTIQYPEDRSWSLKELFLNGISKPIQVHVQFFSLQDLLLKNSEEQKEFLIALFRKKDISLQQQRSG